MLREGGQVRRCLPPSFEVATSKPPRFFLAVESRSCQSHARCSADAIPLLHIEGGRRRSRCSCWAAGTASGQPGPLDPEDSLRGRGPRRLLMLPSRQLFALITQLLHWPNFSWVSDAICIARRVNLGEVARAAPQASGRKSHTSSQHPNVWIAALDCSVAREHKEGEPQLHVTARGSQIARPCR